PAARPDRRAHRRGAHAASRRTLAASVLTGHSVADGQGARSCVLSLDRVFDPGGYPIRVHHGRDLGAGYVRGWGLEFGRLYEDRVCKDQLFQKALDYATRRGTVVTPQKLANIFLILKYGWPALRGGVFDRTLPLILASIPLMALVHIDCDIYEPIKYLLATCEPYYEAGGYVVLDDPMSSSCIGAFDATAEVLLREQRLLPEQVYPHF